MTGQVLFYFPISEYDLDSITNLWGEDINKKYLEKYTLKGITPEENDTFKFNSNGVDKTVAERTVYISKKAFREITGRRDPFEGDMFQWTQNNIIYQVIEVIDQEHIVLGNELTWKLVATPRLVEGEVFGLDDCDNTRDSVATKDQNEVNGCDILEPPIGDGNVIEDPDNVHVPGPSDKTVRNNEEIEADEDSVVIRKSWGNWG